MSNICYNIPIKQAPEILTQCMLYADNIQVDELNCSKSFRRMPTEKTIAEIFELGIKDEHTFYHFIKRTGIEREKEHFDVGLSTMLTTEPNYFLLY